MGLGLGFSYTLPCDDDVAGAKSTLWVMRAWALSEASCVGRVKADSFWSASHRWQDSVWAPKRIVF